MLTHAELERLLSRITAVNGEEGRSQCWVRAGWSSGDGYAKMNWRGRAHMAHRLTFMAFKGSIPKGCVVDHICRNRACIRPSHLRAISMRENTMIGRAKLFCAVVDERSA